MIIMDPSEIGSSDERSPLKGSTPTSPTSPAPAPPPPYGAVPHSGPVPYSPPFPPQYFQSMSHQGSTTFPQGYMPTPPSSPHFQHYSHHHHHEGPHHGHHPHAHGHGPRPYAHVHHPAFVHPHSPHHPHPHHHDSHEPPFHGRRRRSPFIRFCKTWTVAILVLLLWALLMDSLQLTTNSNDRTGRNRPSSRVSEGEGSTPEYRCPCQPVEVEDPLPDVPEAPGRVLPIRYPPSVPQTSLGDEEDAPPKS